MSGAIKICGLTRARDVELVRDLGADYAGFIFAPSPRRIDGSAAAILARLLEGSNTKAVGVFVDEPPSSVREILDTSGIGIAQLHGEEPAEDALAIGVPIIRALRVRDGTIPPGCASYPAAAFLLDRWDSDRIGGTGLTLPWDEIRGIDLPKPCILAGGLNPDNVSKAVIDARPTGGVDVSSGVEEAPGVKDEKRVRDFIRNARAAFGEMTDEK